ncbi:MAG: PepSY-associated TM helix domain-containing protein [Pseudomonadota bacterium]
MSVVNQAQSRRLVAVHGWSGTVLGLLLYVVVLTGAIAVFAHEIGEWATGGHASVEAFAQPIGPRLEELAEDVKPEYLDEVVVFSDSAGNIQVRFHTHEERDGGRIEDIGVRYILDGNNLEVLQRDEGWFSELPRDTSGALEDFIVDVHVNLYAPFPWGLYATGILGLLMLSAVISGVLLHKHIIKDLFVSPRKSSKLLFRKDRHVLAGSWSLPFGFVLAFTGAFYSFAISIGLPVVAMVAFGGDQEQMIETILGAPVPENTAPAQLASLEDVIADTTRRNGAPPVSLTVSHWGRADAVISVFHGPTEEQLYGQVHLFEGTSGEYKGPKPIVGTEPSMGAAVVGLIGPLHFGNFGGLLSKIVWLSLGLACCYVTLTGLQMWVERRAESKAWQRLGRLIPIVGYGTAISLAGAGFGYFLSAGGDPSVWVTRAFVITAVLCIMAGYAVRDRRLMENVFRAALGLGLLALPVLRILTGGPGWGEACGAGASMVIGVDLVMVIAGAAALRSVSRERATARSVQPAVESAV